MYFRLAISILVVLLTPVLENFTPSVSPACRKMRLKGTISRNNRKKDALVSVLDGHVKEPYEFIGVIRHMQQHFSHKCDGTDVQED